jgi:hypothetical protein
VSEDEKNALSNYNTAAQFNATSLIVVVFGQFAILTLVESKGDFLWAGSWPVGFLAVVYGLILVLGCYFILNYLKFAMLIEELRDEKYVLTHRLDVLEKGMVDAIRPRSPLVAWLDSRRGKVLRHCQYLDLTACAVYVLVSCLILLAALFLPTLGR